MNVRPVFEHEFHDSDPVIAGSKVDGRAVTTVQITTIHGMRVTRYQFLQSAFLGLNNILFRYKTHRKGLGTA